MQNVVGPTLVALATTFALGAESNRLPACYYYFFLHNHSIGEYAAAAIAISKPAALARRARVTYWLAVFLSTVPDP